MEALFTPHGGLMVWTIVTFVVLAVILGVFGWPKLIKGLDDRERFLIEQREAAEKANKDAQDLKQKFDVQLTEAQKTIQDMMAQARADGEKSRAQLVAAAREEADRLLEKGRRDLSSETERLKSELRKDVAGLSLEMTEKILKQTVDASMREKLIKNALADLAEGKK